MPFVKISSATENNRHGPVKAILCSTLETIQKIREIIGRITSATPDTYGLCHLPLSTLPVKAGSFSSPPLFASPRDTEDLVENKKGIFVQASSYPGAPTSRAKGRAQRTKNHSPPRF